ncbi:hypothetical protein IWZ00DRAFT_506519 [Phyllosticta capitalensis]
MKATRDAGRAGDGWWMVVVFLTTGTRGQRGLRRGDTGVEWGRRARRGRRMRMASSHAWLASIGTQRSWQRFRSGGH